MCLFCFVLDGGGGGGRGGRAFQLRKSVMRSYEWFYCVVCFEDYKAYDKRRIL